MSAAAWLETLVEVAERVSLDAVKQFVSPFFNFQIPKNLPDCSSSPTTSRACATGTETRDCGKVAPQIG